MCGVILKLFSSSFNINFSIFFFLKTFYFLTEQNNIVLRWEWSGLKFDWFANYLSFPGLSYVTRCFWKSYISCKRCVFRQLHFDCLPIDNYSVVCRICLEVEGLNSFNEVVRSEKCKSKHFCKKKRGTIFRFSYFFNSLFQTYLDILMFGNYMIWLIPYNNTWLRKRPMRTLNTLPN